MLRQECDMSRRAATSATSCARRGDASTRR
uniref:Uncharacterized protein n=1 Tax=Siphoviridae sp. ctPrm3 TaxID=2827864 RepID=A0A8S5TPB6_9CAUD|nr:MAG TPA: hypothetical protein [Siphoviridae sp. ctPrm3]